MVFLISFYYFYYRKIKPLLNRLKGFYFWIFWFIFTLFASIVLILLFCFFVEFLAKNEKYSLKLPPLFWSLYFTYYQSFSQTFSNKFDFSPLFKLFSKLIFWSSLSYLIFLIFDSSSSAQVNLTADSDKNNLLFCPLRGYLKQTKLDSRGNYTEEYQRIKLIKILLKLGYEKKDIYLEHRIPIGHKGHNHLRVDLIVKKGKKIILVSEIKKNFSRQIMQSAIDHQLIPAMNILQVDLGIYYDGTANSCWLLRKGKKIVKKNFP